MMPDAAYAPLSQDTTMHSKSFYLPAPPTIEIRFTVSPLIMVEKQPSAIICGGETSLLIKIIDCMVEMKLKSVPALSMILIKVVGLYH